MTSLGVQFHRHFMTALQKPLVYLPDAFSVRTDRIVRTRHQKDRSIRNTFRPVQVGNLSETGKQIVECAGRENKTAERILDIAVDVHRIAGQPVKLGARILEFLPNDNGEQRIANLLGKALFAKTDVCEKQYSVPYSVDLLPAETAKLFEQSILNDGGLHVALLAARQDGSLLMNRCSDCNPETHVETIDDDGFITAGLNVLMQAKHPIVVATGKSSAEAVRTMLKGSIVESPLAALKLHPGATFVLDEEAAELL